MRPDLTNYMTAPPLAETASRVAEGIRSHAAQGNEGYDPFTLDFHKTFTLEQIGLNESDHFQSYKNRKEVREVREKLAVEVQELGKEADECREANKTAYCKYVRVRETLLRGKKRQPEAERSRGASAEAEGGGTVSPPVLGNFLS